MKFIYILLIVFIVTFMPVFHLSTNADKGVTVRIVDQGAGYKCFGFFDQRNALISGSCIKE